MLGRERTTDQIQTASSPDRATSQTRPDCTRQAKHDRVAPRPHPSASAVPSGRGAAPTHSRRAARGSQWSRSATTTYRSSTSDTLRTRTSSYEYGVVSTGPGCRPCAKRQGSLVCTPCCPKTARQITRLSSHSAVPRARRHMPCIRFLARRVPHAGSDERHALGIFLGLQIGRTPEAAERHGFARLVLDHIGRDPRLARRDAWLPSRRAPRLRTGRERGSGSRRRCQLPSPGRTAVQSRASRADVRPGGT